VKAVLRPARDSWAVGSTQNMSAWEGTVTVKPGKDTVIEMPLNQ